MAAVASQLPSGFTAGVSVDQNFQPLDACGIPNSLFYHQFVDDFNYLTPNLWSATTTGTGAAAVAAAAGDGGLVSGTSGTTAGAVGIQGSTAGFTVNSAPKKVFFEMRAQLSNVTDAGITLVAGLMNAGSAGAPTDGVYFTYINGVWKINSAVASAVNSVTIPAAAIAMANATNFDIGFYINRFGDVLAFLDTQLVGYVPQSNLATTGNPQNAGAVSRITAPTLTAVNLSPGFFIVQTGANARTVTVDFIGAWKER